MLQSVKTYVHDKRKGLSITAGVVGGVYFLQQYVSDRLEEVKDRLEEERLAREALRRRFRQTQDDVSYTILALIPTLSEQILKEMDVEGLTQELQTISRARAGAGRLPLQLQRPPSSLASSADMMHDQDMRPDAGATVPSLGPSSRSASQISIPEADTNLSVSTGLQGWVEASTSASSDVSLVTSSDSLVGVDNMSDSIMTMQTVSSTGGGENASVDGSGMSDSIISSSATSSSSITRTRAELWSEVKMLTFTRTLTTLYSTTLLTLLTTIQLTLLARSKYVNAIVQHERDERLREQLDAQFSLSNLLLGGGKGLEAMLSGDILSLFEDDAEINEISEETESKYLTLGWWILHVGWKDVGERVRRGVEEVFDGVSLKSKLASIDLHRLVSDVRRRVEHEVTFEGNERRINFLSTLLPPTPETIQHVLTQGGFTPDTPDTPIESDSAASSQLSHNFTSSPALGLTTLHNASSQQSHPIHPHPHTQDASFTALLLETRSIISSSDFAHVLEVCLDRATDILFSGLERSVFVSSEPPPTPGEDVRIRLAGLLPGLARWSVLALNGLPNELVDELLDLREVSCLSAIIFSKFEDQFR